MAVVPPIVVPLVANAEALVKAMHDMLDENGGCEHKEGTIISFRACEVMAQTIMDKGGFKSSAEMIGSLKDNEDVQNIITEGMAEAWDEGHDAACPDPDGFCFRHINPYKVKP